MMTTTRALTVLVVLVGVSTISGCRHRPYFVCSEDSQCGPNGVCREGGCAFPDSSCPSGHRWDSSAEPPKEGQCVPPATPDMAPPVDVDMACGGQPCVAGLGACQATGKTRCDGSCDATPGTPSNDFHLNAAPNGSWDWDCDGHVSFQYPNGDATPPFSYDDVGKQPPPSGDCAGVTTQTECQAPHWFFTPQITPRPALSCGWAVQNDVCLWMGGGTSTKPCANAFFVDSKNQGCK